MILFLPAWRRIFALAFFAAAVSCATANPASTAGGEDPARARLRAAYLKSIEAELVEAKGTWPQAAVLHGEAGSLFSSLKRDYPGWQSDLLDRRIAECQNRADNARLQTQSTSATPQPSRAQKEDRLERLLEELTRVRAILANDSALVPANLSSENPSDADLVRTNRQLKAEVEKLNKRILSLEKQKPGRKSSGPAATLSPTNAVCATLIRDTARTQIQAGQADPAIELLTEASLIYPDDLEMKRLLATAYCRVSRFRDAIRLLTEIPDPAPESLLILGSAYLATGQLGPARRALESCLESRPDSAEASYNMAQLLLALSPPDIPGARAYYRSSLESGGARDTQIENIIGQATMLENIKKFKRK